MLVILKPEELRNHREKVGPKALNLLRLIEAGCNVPNFLVLPSTNFPLKESEIEDLKTKIPKLLPCKSYAVRSSALNEDTSTSSMAGQYLTFLDVKKSELKEAIVKITAHAQNILKGNLSQFSMIIMDYIPADYSGVAFTRHPAGGRQMLIEYHAGIGEELVSGKVKPKNVELFWTEKIPASELPLSKAVPFLKKIEELQNFPQDAEWCVRNGEWYFVQTRPITTLTPEKYSDSQYLDAILPRHKPFYFAQTEICEIAPRPSPFTFSILKKIYAQGGPIQKAYANYGVEFEPRDFLKLIGNQLYVDKEEELKTLLPTYTYFGKSKLKPSSKGWSGFWRSWKNARALNKLKADDHVKYAKRLKLELTKIPTQSLDQIWKSFEKSYALIFEVNLLAGKYIAELDQVLKPYHRTAVSVLSSSFRLKIANLKDAPPDNSWLGNGLEINDAVKFTAREPIYGPNQELESWWSSLPEWRKKYLQPYLERCIAFDALREHGRWLTVGYVNALREKIGGRYFYTLEECLSGSGSSDDYLTREKEYLIQNSRNFPPELTNVIAAGSTEKISGVSSGRAEGTLVTADQLAINKEPVLLYTEILTPDLVQYFPIIKGIVSKHGGVLSHLSILAREQGIPVVTNAALGKEVTLGTYLRIDGNKGTIEVINKLS